MVIETLEEARAEALVAHVADRLQLPYFVWTVSQGLRRAEPHLAGQAKAIFGTQTPKGCLDHIEASTVEALYHLKDLRPHLDDPLVVARLKDSYAKLSRHRGAIVLTDVVSALPADVARMATALRLADPTQQEYLEYLRALLADVRKRHPVANALKSDDVERLLPLLRGLTFVEVKKLMTQAMLADGVLDQRIFERVNEAKRAVVERTGVLEYFPTGEGLEDIAGLDTLKRWLKQRTVVFRDPKKASSFGLPAPRGLLLLGVQGCGKSLCAKAVARAWKLPLLRFDPSRIYNKYVGETEKNLQQAIRVAEAMAPVVLWIDEIEKAFAEGGSEDGGVSQRVLGQFLQWLQEKKAPVFVMATSNDVTRLPPELLRKGRFDELFFVDLPTAAVRAQILGLHLRRRGRDPAQFDLAALAAAADQFSGAELEQVVVSALYTAFSEDRPLDDALLRGEIAQTRPLAVTMAEPIALLRAWADGRTVRAD